MSGIVDLMAGVPEQAVVVPLAGDDDRAADGVDAGLLGEHETAGFDKPCALHGIWRHTVERQRRVLASRVNLHLARAGNGPTVVAGLSAVVELEREVPVDDGNRAGAERISE